MATVSKTIIAGGGGDYTTIAGWEAGTNLNSGADIWKGVVSDNSTYDETVSFNVDGTSTSSYVWLTVASGNRHAGVYTTGKALWHYTGATGNMCYSTADYFRVEWLQIVRTEANANDYAVYILNGEENLVSYCLIFSLDETPDNNSVGIYGYHTAGTNRTLYVDNSMIWGWGVGLRTYAGGTHKRYVDHCHISYNCNGTVLGQANIGEYSGSGNLTYTVYNTVVVDTLDAGSEELATRPKTTEVLNGTHNCRTSSAETGIDFSTDNSTNWQDATNGHSDGTPTSGAYVVIENEDLTDFTLMDLRLKDNAYNVCLENGTDRQGSEPDPAGRQDFSVDITGASRPTTGVDIGPHQLSSDADTTVTPGEATGAAAADAPSIAITVTAGEATAAAAADNATAATAVVALAGEATAAAAADDVAITIAVTSGEATAAGVADIAAVSIAVTVGEATAAGVADDATVSTSAAATALAGEATAAGVADGPAVALTVTSGEATGAGVADDATTSTSVSVTALAGEATAAGSAFGATAALTVGAGEATGAAVAFAAAQMVIGAHVIVAITEVRSTVEVELTVRPTVEIGLTIL